MCGIVGAVARREIAGILCEGLHRLEYRGYDSAGIAVVSETTGAIQRIRTAGKVRKLVEAIGQHPLQGAVGIAHTRWATHGKPTEINAHPHLSSESLALVHNGIIENHEELRAGLIAAGYVFESETDSEVIAHLAHQQVKAAGDLVTGFRNTVKQLRGAYALAAVHRDYPGHLVGARMGSPLIVGIGIGENFIASDPQALRQVTDRFIYLEEGELVDLGCDEVSIFGVNKDSVESRTIRLDSNIDIADKAGYRHFMLKEIFEQPRAIKDTLADRISENRVLEAAFGEQAPGIFAKTRAVQIVACGSSYYTALIARYWIEELAGIPCMVEIASEIRYRKVAVQQGTLFVSISQSGETADTLAALSAADDPGYIASLCICNVADSSLVRESDFTLLIHAGPEIGVASTKAFTTQLTDLLMLAICLGAHNNLSDQRQGELVAELRRLPAEIEKVLQLDSRIREVAEAFVEKHHALFLGRGMHYPVALEGALKLKEISYIHAEGYPAGELKHGPLALVDEDMPVVAVAPNNDLLAKLKSNLHEVKARGGQLFVFADAKADFGEEEGVVVVPIPGEHTLTSPIIYTIPMQLLSYYVAVLKGTDVDQPRNLAKSVTVE